MRYDKSELSYPSWCILDPIQSPTLRLALTPGQVFNEMITLFDTNFDRTLRE